MYYRLYPFVVVDSTYDEYQNMIVGEGTIFILLLVTVNL